jgi:ABC-type phosphate transport system substrate-binding protein
MFMSRTHLLGAASAAALACFSAAASAAGVPAHSITGGGSTLAEYDYYAEFSTFNVAECGTAYPTSACTKAAFDNGPGPTGTTNLDTLYWASGSGIGQSSFLYNDITCDAQKTLNGNKTCPTSGTSPGGADVTHYGASDATLSTTQIAFWSTYSYGQSAARDLIQIPSMGVGVSFPVQNATITTNSQVTLTDSDLCGIFSGKITDWSGTSAFKAGHLTAGTIDVVYRSDSSGTSFIFSNHLAAVCTTANSNFTLPISATTTFANILPAAALSSPNFIGESGSSAVATELQSLTSATGYLSPDFTNVDPNSGAPNHTLIPAYILNGKTAYLPTVANVASGLNHVSTAAQYASENTNIKPPANATDAANPAKWVPTTGFVTTGYPVVGYTTFDLAQCYADKTIGAGIIAFMKLHYSTNATYAGIISTNGFVSIASSGAKAFAGPIQTAILSNRLKYGVDIDDTTNCVGFAGR